MPGSRVPTLIGDANVLIDFARGELLGALFKLSSTLAVPDLVFEDELRAQHPHLIDRGLVLVELGSTTIDRVMELSATYRKTSRLDLFALAAAEQEDAVLLTGDKHLRKAAEAEGIEVHGTLWLADQLISEGLISVDRLTEAYTRMRACGRRLPWTEVQRQIERLATTRPEEP